MQFFSVSGDANFSMKHTGLTIGGFTQPFVARNLIDVQANVEKGLCQRFLWLVPEPPMSKCVKLMQNLLLELVSIRLASPPIPSC